MLLWHILRFLPLPKAVFDVIDALEKFLAGETVYVYITWKDVRIRISVDKTGILKIERV